MHPIDDTTYKAPANEVEVFIGDPKQSDFYPRLKIQKWNNEVNFSIGVIGNGGQVISGQDKITWQDKNTAVDFYPTYDTDHPTQSKIRWIKEGYITPQRIAAEYEVDRYIDWDQQVIRSHFTDKKAMLYYGYYPKKAYLDKDIDIPEVRISATRHNDPMLMDKGLPLVCIHYKDKRDDLEKLQKSMIQAVTEIVDKYGIKAYAKPDYEYKLYFEDKGRDVKFFSTSFVDGYYYFYVNLELQYNDALKYTNKEPRNDVYAYGLRSKNPAIPDSIIDEIIIRYSELYGLTLQEEKFSDKEEEIISRIESEHDNQWIINASRGYHKLIADEGKENGFEFDVILDNKPESNVYPLSIKTKGLVFHKQDDEIDFVKGFRAPRVHGSYAVYHDSKRNNEYGAGKAFHIYRPYVTDANGWRVWADLDIDLSKELLNVTMPQNFLNSAKYPIVIDPAFGYTTVGASAVSSADTITQSEATLSTAGNAGGIFVYGGNDTGKTEMAIYNQAGTTRLFYTGEFQMNTTKWWGQALPHTYIGAGTYRLATWSAPGTYVSSIYYDSTSGTSYSLSSTYSAGNMPTDIATGATTQSGRLYSIFSVAGYQWPVMAGSKQSMLAAARYQPLNTGTATNWVTTISNQPVISPQGSGGAITDLRVNLTTAPGSGTARAMTIYIDEVATLLAATISDTATTATDSTNAARYLPGVAGIIANDPSGSPATTVNNAWRMVITSTYQSFKATSISTASASATRYMGLMDFGGISTSSAGGSQTFPNDTGVMQNWAAKLTDGTITSGSYTITLYKNGSPTSCVMTITSQTSTYTGGTVSATTGDVFYYQIVPSSPSTARRIAISCEYVSNTAGRGVLMGGNNSTIGTSGSTYSSWDNDIWTTTEAEASVLSYTHTIVGMYASLSVAPGAGKSRMMRYRDNGSSTGTPSITISNTSITGSWTGSYAVTADHLVDVEAFVSAGVPANSKMAWGIVFDAPALVPPAAGNTSNFFRMFG